MAAPPEKVWAALTDGARLARWLPPDGVTGELRAYEPRLGGKLELTLHFPDGVAGKAGEGRDEVVGKVVELEPGHRIAWEVRFPSDDPAYAGRMTMRWTLDPVGRGTRVTVEALHPPPGIDAEVHSAALEQSLAHLAPEAAT